MSPPKPKPTFLVLPKPVTPKEARLGCFAVDIYSPGTGSVPLRPPVLNKDWITEPQEETNARGMLHDVESHSFWTHISKLINLDFSREAVDSTYWKTGTIFTQKLTHAELALPSLMNDPDVAALFRVATRNKRRKVYMVVGIKTWTDTSLTIESNASSVDKASVTLPVGNVATQGANALLAPFSESLDVNSGVELGHNSTSFSSSVLQGQSVFAVQYRRVKFRKAKAIELNEAKKLGPSVFGGHEDAEHESNAIASGGLHGTDKGEDNLIEVELMEDDIDETAVENYRETGRVTIGGDDYLYNIGEFVDEDDSD